MSQIRFVSSDVAAAVLCRAVFVLFRSRPLSAGYQMRTQVLPDRADEGGAGLPTRRPRLKHFRRRPYHRAQAELRSDVHSGSVGVRTPI